MQFQNVLQILEKFFEYNNLQRHMQPISDDFHEDQGAESFKMNSKTLN